MDSKEQEFLPKSSDIRQELQREQYRKRFFRTMRSTVYVLLVVAAAAVLLATLFLPVLRIHGTSMTPTVAEGEIIMAVKTPSFQKGDILALYYGNKLLVKRCIASPGQWVDIDNDGNVYVDGELLNEPYLTEKAKGECTVEFPYQVPDNRYFVLGDHRSVSQDSRSETIGCIAKDQIIGRILLRVWPLNRIGTIR